MKLSIFTVIMPEFTIEETARELGKIGYDGVEWRVNTIPRESPKEGVSYWGYNRSTIDPDEMESKAKWVREVSEKERLEISCLATYMRVDEAEKVAKVMGAASVMGCPRVRVNVPRYDGTINYNALYKETVENLKKIEKLAREHGVKAVIEMHMGNIMPSAGLAYRIVSNFKPEHVGVIYDPGNMMYEGFESWQMGLELLGPYVAHVHVKNAIWRPVKGEPDGTIVWKATSAPLKNGMVNWREVVEALKRVGYRGYLSSEDFSTEEKTLDKITSGYKYLKSML